MGSLVVAILLGGSPHDPGALLSITGGDGTPHFETPVLAPVGNQLDCTKLLSDRRLTIYDEPNEKNVDVIFSSRAEATNFMLCLTAAVCRAKEGTESVAIALNEAETRKNKAIEKPAELNYDVTLTVSHLYVLSSSTLVPERADELPTGTTAIASVGGSQAAMLAQGTATLDGLLLVGKEGLSIVGSFSEKRLSSDAGWLAVLVNQAAGGPADAADPPSRIVSVALVITRIEQSDESKKDVLRKRLQKIGAHAAIPTALSNNSFGKPSNNSFPSKSAAAAPVSAAVADDNAVSASSPAPGVAEAEHQKQDAAVEPAVTDVPSEKKKKKKKSAQVLQDELEAAEAAAEEQRAAAASASMLPEDPAAEPPTSEALVDFQLKLERKKQRVLKFEAEVVQRHEELQHVSQLQSLKEAELSAQRAALDADIAQFNQQKDAFNRQQLTFYQEKDHEDATRMHSTGPVKVKGSINRASNQPGGSERQPLLSVTTAEAAFTFRVEQNFYDNTAMPPSFSRQYPATTTVLNMLVMSRAGLAAVLVFIVAGAALLSTAIGSQPHLWPFLALDVMAFISIVNIYRHNQRLSDDLHRIDQSCSQFEPTVFILRRSLLFLVLPTLIFVAVLAPALLLMATDMADTLGRVGVVVGLAGSLLALGVVYLFIVLASCVSWDRIANTVSQEPGALCTRLSLRRALAQYQFLKGLVTSCNQEMSTDVVLIAAWLLCIMGYCVIAAVRYRSYDVLIAYNAIFAGAALLMWGLLRCCSGWQGATRLAIGCVALHADRWARGDHNSESDARLDDFVTLQTALEMSCVGSAYAKWTVGLSTSGGGAPPLVFTVSRIWAYVFAFLAAAGAVMVPVVIEYRLQSFYA